MGKNTKACKAFIESISDNKLTAFGSSGGTIVKDQDFRLDMQGLTSGKPQKYNLQVQINRETTITSLKKSAPQTVALCLVPMDMSMTPAQIKAALIKDIRI